MRVRFSLRTLLVVVVGLAVLTAIGVNLTSYRKKRALNELYHGNRAMIAIVKNSKEVQATKIGGKRDPRGFYPLTSNARIDEFDMSDLVVLDTAQLSTRDEQFIRELMCDPGNFAHLYASCGRPTYQMRVRLRNGPGEVADIYLSFQADHALFLYNGDVIGGAETDPMRHRLEKFFRRVFPVKAD
jgi:hypothetical protein